VAAKPLQLHDFSQQQAVTQDSTDTTGTIERKAGVQQPNITQGSARV